MHDDSYASVREFILMVVKIEEEERREGSTRFRYDFNYYGYAGESGEVRIDVNRQR